MPTKLHQFNIPLDKIACPTKDCGAQRELCIIDTRDRATKELIGATISFQCCQCYDSPEHVLIVNYIKES